MTNKNQVARTTIKTGLNKLPENCQTLFKRMYSADNLQRNIAVVVDLMPTKSLNIAMKQVQRSLDNRNLR